MHWTDEEIAEIKAKRRKKIDLSTKFDFDNVIEFKDAENCQKMMKILKEDSVIALWKKDRDKWKFRENDKITPLEYLYYQRK